MLIRCPHCLYSKQVAPEQLPTGSTRATCPKCHQSFDLPCEESAVNENAKGEPSAATEPLQAEEAPDRLPGRSEIDAQPKAGFWIRVTAALLDGVIVFVLQFVLGFLLALTGSAAGNGNAEILSVVVMLFGYVLSFAYYICFTGYCGQTPGKMAVRVKVIRCNGNDLGYGRAAYREVVCKFISGIILCIGYLMVAFDEQKQGLHDRMADTYVIKL